MVDIIDILWYIVVFSTLVLITIIYIKNDKEK